MAWAHIQSAGANTFSSSIGATFASNVSAGNKIIAIVASSYLTVPSTVQDGSSNALTLLGSETTSTGSVWLFAMDVPAGDVGTTPTITATWTNSNGQAILIQEVSGLLAGNTTAMIDGSPGVLSGTTAATGSPTYSSTAANEYLICAYGDDNGNAAVTAVSGWTLDSSNQSTFADASAEYKNSTGGSETSGFTTASTNGWAILTVAFKLAGGGSAPAPYPALRQAIRARTPQGRRVGGFYNGYGTDSLQAAGSVMWNGGAPVRNPIPGPVFRQRTTPARFTLPPPHPRAGRIGSSFGTVFQAPPHAPPVYPRGTVRAKIPRNIAGSIADGFNGPSLPGALSGAGFGSGMGSGGAPVKNPVQGPVFYQKPFPCRARIPQNAPRGRTGSNPGGPVSNPAPSGNGPVFFPARQAIRAKILRYPVAGVIGDGSKSPAVPGALNGAGFGGGIGSGGAPLKNPNPGPVFRQAVKALRAQAALHPRAGRITGISAGGPVNNPIPPTEYLFIGHYAVEYPDYVDVFTDEMLICIPNQMYLMAVVQNRYGLTIPPPDGRWLGETEQPDEAVLVNPAHRATIEMAMARKRNAELQARSARGERITPVEEKPDDASG